jgi:hypothetical protein
LDVVVGLCFGKKLKWLKVVEEEDVHGTLKNLSLKRHAGARIKAKEKKFKLSP